jgi:GNAT superfamily N-acetyltransferase
VAAPEPSPKGHNPRVETLRLVDELAANAWPAPVAQQVDAWLLRYGWGVTRRANSALPSATDPGDFEACVDATIRAYRGWEAPARVQVTGGLVPGLDEYLGDLGWTTEGACHIMVADLDDVVAAAPGEGATELCQAPDDDWIAFWWSAGRGGTPPTAAGRIVGLPLPCVAHARRSVEGIWASVGRGVCERGWLGLFALATRLEVARNGHATAIVGALARWAAGLGATRAYLQVEIENDRAQALFTRLGFSRIGGYHYRTQPPP